MPPESNNERVTLAIIGERQHRIMAQLDKMDKTIAAVAENGNERIRALEIGQAKITTRASVQDAGVIGLNAVVVMVMGWFTTRQ